jgi:hypothetical protein
MINSLLLFVPAPLLGIVLLLQGGILTIVL